MSFSSPTIADVSITPLRYFLQTSMLSTDAQVEEDEADKPVSSAARSAHKADDGSESYHFHCALGQRTGVACRFHPS